MRRGRRRRRRIVRRVGLLRAGRGPSAQAGRDADGRRGVPGGRVRPAADRQPQGLRGGLRQGAGEAARRPHGEVGEHAVLRPVLAGAEELRRRHQRDHHHPEARQGRRLQRSVLRRQPGLPRDEGRARRAGQEHRRHEGPPVRLPGHHDGRRLHQGHDQAQQAAARVHHARGGHAGARQRPDRRVRDGRRDRLEDRPAAAERRRDDRAVPDRRALRGAHAEGQLAAPEDQRRDREAQEQRPAGGDAREVVPRHPGPADPLVVASIAPATGTRSRTRLTTRQNVVVSAVSTIVFFVLVGTAIALSPGASKVVESFFSVAGFKDSFSTVVAGFWLNVKLMVIAEALVLVFALAVAVVRSLPGPVLAPLRVVALIYTDVFRAVPLILVVFIVGLGIPGLQLSFISDRSVFTYGVVALVLVYSAYVAEVYRAGIDSVHPSPLAGAGSLGLSQWQAMRHVVLPQAIRRVIPPLLNDFIGLQKDTALVGLLGLVEVARAAENYASETFNFSGYTMAALLFIAVTIPLARATDYLIERDRRRMRASGG